MPSISSPVMILNMIPENSYPFSSGFAGSSPVVDSGSGSHVDGSDGLEVVFGCFDLISSSRVVFQETSRCQPI